MTRNEKEGERKKETKEKKEQKRDQDKCKQIKSESKMNRLLLELWKWSEGGDTIK